MLRTLILPLIALSLSVTGCAAIRTHQTAETEQVLAAAGFQVKPADTPEKLAHLQTLTPRKVVRYTRDGQLQYAYADPDTCKCVYVGDESVTRSSRNSACRRRSPMSRCRRRMPTGRRR